MSRPPIPLGAFDLEQPVGSGSSARVWRASHRDSGPNSPQVAVKILSGRYVQDQRWASAFRREVQSVASLEHPNIVRVFDHGIVPYTAPFKPEDGVEVGSPYLAMEFLSGGTLTGLAGRLNWSDLKVALLTILDALAHAHARGVLHRDIKPSNLLLGPAGVTLTDFGLGYDLSQDDPDANRMLGTPAYMAPEQFECRWRDFGPWTDLYSLGCTAYALACARPPFGSRQSVDDSMHSHLFSPPPKLTAARPVPGGFQDWIHRLMRKSPDRRFRWAADAAWALSVLELTEEEEAEQAEAMTELSIQNFRTLDIPSEIPTALSLSYRFALGTPPEEDEELRPNFAPPCPSHWRRPGDTIETPRLLGVGLGLYGLRSIPLVDRETERTRLWAKLQEVHRSGRTQVAILSGGGGTGKSRLARWLCERAHEAGAASILRAYHASSPGPGTGLAEMVTHYFGCANLARGDTQKRLHQTFQDEFTLSEEEAEALTEFINPATDADREAGLEAIRFESPTERNALIERLIRRETSDRPVVLWLDDAHWGLDSLFFVLHLLARQDESPLRALVVLTCRHDMLVEREAEAELIEQLQAMDECEQIPVGPLAAEDRSALVRELLGLEGELAERVEERTAGNPLFAVQLVGNWVQRGLLLPGARGFELRSGASIQLPDDIHQVWSDRIARLLAEREETDGQALELAAMLGQRVEWTEWRTACKLRGLRVSGDLVDALVRSRLAEVPGTQRQDNTWVFVHGMLRESLKRRAWEAGRAADLHRVCAAILKQRYGAEAAARHAHHLLAAGDLAQAVEPLARAAESFIESGEFRQASVILDDRSRALDRLGIAPGAEERVEELLLRSDQARAARELPPAGDFAQRAETAARAAGYSSLVARALRNRGAVLGNQGKLLESQKILTQAVELAESIGESRCLADSKRGLGAALTQLGRFEEAEVNLTEALKLYRRLGNGYGVTVCQLSLARLAGNSRRFERSRELAEQ
ncbi:MAG: protein kinase, partial [Myxococcota bacterium]|nr:protein kinase [Myxococcota bacterium]